MCNHLMHQHLQYYDDDSNEFIHICPTDTIIVNDQYQIQLVLNNDLFNKHFIQDFDYYTFSTLIDLYQTNVHSDEQILEKIKELLTKIK